MPRTRPSERVRIVVAVRDGAKTSKEASSRARVPIRNAYAYVSKLRAEGFLKGDSKSLRITPKGRTLARSGSIKARAR